jgi:hypothetical protein
MARIKIEDLPKDLELSQKELRQVLGGVSGLTVQLKSTRPRQTSGTTFGSVLGQALSSAADVVMSAGEIAAPSSSRGDNDSLTSSVSG